MRKSKYNSFDELPADADRGGCVSHVLGIGLAHAYEVAHRRDFPTISGQPHHRPRDKFMEWIDEQAVKNLRYYDRLQWICRKIQVSDVSASRIRKLHPLGG